MSYYIDFYGLNPLIVLKIFQETVTSLGRLPRQFSKTVHNIALLFFFKDVPLKLRNVLESRVITYCIFKCLRLPVQLIPKVFMDAHMVYNQAT